MPSRSRILAGCDIGGLHVEREEKPFRSHQDMPRAADQLLGAILAAFATDAGRLHRLAVYRAGAGLRIPTELGPQVVAQDQVDPR